MLHHEQCRLWRSDSYGAGNESSAGSIRAEVFVLMCGPMFIRSQIVPTLLLIASLPALVVPLFEVKSPHGIDFTLQNSPTSLKYLIETMPGGVALLDYNNDGLLDIFLVNGGRIGSPMQQPDNFDRTNPRYWNRLYRQN